jgi:membrane-bound lytic murein transglycosylase B
MMFRRSLLVWILFLLMLTPGKAWSSNNLFSSLSPILVAKGADAQQVKEVLASPELKFEARIMANMLSAKETMRNYKQFLDKKVVAKGRKFLKKHKKTLQDNHEQTAVEPELVVALMLVETRLGAYTGRYNVLNVLLSQAVLNQKEAKKLMKTHWPKGRKKEINSAKNKKRFKKRANWAAGEVAAVLKLSKDWKVSPHSLKGSPAGAMGMCQFMPTSILRWAKDGDNDGKIQLHQPADAIHSVGNYLQYFGWAKGISKAQKLKVLLKYNHSTPYAKTILQLAGKLK